MLKHPGVELITRRTDPSYKNQDHLAQAETGTDPNFSSDFPRQIMKAGTLQSVPVIRGVIKKYLLCPLLFFSYIDLSFFCCTHTNIPDQRITGSQNFEATSATTKRSEVALVLRLK
jgi:hypothetical protein